MKRLLSSRAVLVALTTQGTPYYRVLDQQNLLSPSSGIAISDVYSRAQTATCGLGGILSGVDVEVSKGSAITNDLVLSNATNWRR